MPMLIDTESRSGDIARVSGVGPASIHGQLGSREHLLRVAAGGTCRARVASLRAESDLDGILLFLPRDADQILDTRAWLGWLEQGRVETAQEVLASRCHTLSASRVSPSQTQSKGTA